MFEKTLPRPIIEDALDCISDRDFDTAIRTDYSGRGMYGKTCLGIVLDSETQLATFAVALIDSAYNEFGEDDDDAFRHFLALMDNLMDDVRLDNMGRDIIAYFPGWTLDEDDS